MGEESASARRGNLVPLAAAAATGGAVAKTLEGSEWGGGGGGVGFLSPLNVFFSTLKGFFPPLRNRFFFQPRRRTGDGYVRKRECALGLPAKRSV